ncbi:MAG: Ig-like domain-containing protein, partial [Candidatus Wallbacteria bacterium]|nr:Ig-like domain-containing protein [Candidatus Wallbacteria bacterium]
MTRFVLMSIMCLFSICLYADSVATVNNADPSDNDGIYKAGQIIKITYTPTVQFQWKNGSYEVWNALANDKIGVMRPIPSGGAQYFINDTDLWDTTGWNAGAVSARFTFSTGEIIDYFSTPAFGVIIDNTAPVVGSINPTNGTTISGSQLTITINFTETNLMDNNIPVTVTLGGNPVSVTSYSGNSWQGTITPAAGVQTLSISGGTDRAGNVMTANNSNSYTVDATPPTVTGVTTVPAQPTTFILDQSVTFTITFSENMDQATAPTVTYCGGTVSGNFSNATTWSGTRTIPSGYSGNQALSISGAKDAIGNTMVADSSNTFAVDSVKPTISGIVTTPSAPKGASSGNPFTLGYITFEITFSETMNTGVSPTITLGAASVSQLSYVGSTWTGRVQVTAGWGGLAPYMLSVSGAKDSAGNQMDTNTSYSYWINALQGDADFSSMDTKDSDDDNDNDEMYHTGQQIIVQLNTINDTIGKATCEVYRTNTSYTTGEQAMSVQGTGTSKYYSYTWNTSGLTQNTDQSDKYKATVYYGNGKESSITPITLEFTKPNVTGITVLDAGMGSEPFSAETVNISISFTDPGSTPNGIHTDMNKNKPLTVSLSGVGSFTGAWDGALQKWDGSITINPSTYSGVSTLSISGAEDRAANTINTWTGTLKSTCEVDTHAPSVTSATSNPAAPIGAGATTFTVTFTDSGGTNMNTGIQPTVTFGGNAVTGNWTSETAWVGSITVPSGWTGSKTLSVSGARDQVGYVMNPNPYTKDFTCDAATPEVTSITVNPPEVVPIGNATFTVDFSKNMDTTKAMTATFGTPGKTVNLANPTWVSATQWTGTANIASTEVWYVAGATQSVTLSLSGAKDPSNNTMAATSEAFVVDVTRPTFTVTATGIPPYLIDDKVTFEITYSEVMDTSEATYAIKFDGKAVTGGWSAGGTSWSGCVTITTLFTDGTCELSIANAKDLAGNATASNPDTSKKYKVDSSRPTVTDVSPAPTAWFNTQETIVFSITFSEAMTTETSLTPEVSLVKVGAPATLQYLTFGGWNTGKTVWTGSVQISGTIFPVTDTSLSLEVKLGHDKAGNTMEAYSTKTYYTDYTPPVMTVWVDDEYPIYRDGSTMNLAASSEVDLVSVEVNVTTVDDKQLTYVALTEDTADNFSGTHQIHSNNGRADGAYLLGFYGYDSAENTVLESLEVWLDNTSPEVRLDGGLSITFETCVISAGSAICLSTETQVTVYFYDSSEIWDFGMDLTAIPSVTLGATPATLVSYVTEEIGGLIYGVYTGTLTISSSLDGTKTLTIADAKDLAGNIMKTNTSKTVEVQTGKPLISTLKVYNNGRLLNNSGDYIGIGWLSCEVMFDDTMETRIPPKIVISDSEGATLELDTTGYSFKKTTRTNDTFVCPNNPVTEETTLLTDGYLTVEITEALNLSWNKMDPMTYKNFQLDTVRPSLETVAWAPSTKLLTLSFSENIRSSAATNVNPNIIMYKGSATGDNLLKAPGTNYFTSYTISGSTMTITLNSALTDATYEIIVGSTETTCVKDLAYNIVSTSEVGVIRYDRKVLDFSAPLVSNLKVRDLKNNQYIDSVNWFLKYHPSDPGSRRHSNAESVEITFDIYEPDGLTTSSVTLYWDSEFDSPNFKTASSMSFSQSGGTYSVSVRANLTELCPNIGRPGTVSFWLSAYDTKMNFIGNGNSSTSPAGTVKASWLAPAKNVKAEVNPRVQYPGRTTNLTVSIAPEMTTQECGIEKIVISNLPNTPGTVGLSYHTKSGGQVDFSSSDFSVTKTASTLTLNFTSNNLDITDNVKTIEVFCDIDAKSAADPPAGVTLEVMVANNSTATYPPTVNNASKEVTATAYECDGIDNSGEPTYVRSELNVQTRKPAETVIAEIVPYLVSPGKSDLAMKYFIRPTLTQAVNAWINRVMVDLDGITLQSVDSVYVGGVIRPDITTVWSIGGDT